MQEWGEIKEATHASDKRNGSICAMNWFCEDRCLDSMENSEQFKRESDCRDSDKKFIARKQEKRRSAGLVLNKKGRSKEKCQWGRYDKREHKLVLAETLSCRHLHFCTVILEFPDMDKIMLKYDRKAAGKISWPPFNRSKSDAHING